MPLRLTRPVARKKRSGKKASQIPHTETRIHLDRFSQEDLRTWERSAYGINEYHTRLYYHLESLRSLNREKICESLQSSDPISIELENWARIVDYKYSLEPLSAIGSLRKGGRFNIGKDLDPGKFPSYPALYIAEDYETAYIEKFGAPSVAHGNELPGNEFALRTESSFTAVRISGRLNNLFDVSYAANLKSFAKIIEGFKIPDDLKSLGRSLGIKQPWLISKPGDLKKSILAKDWLAWPTQLTIPANSQVFGRLINDAGFEGILYPSARASGKCIAVFPENIAGSESEVILSDTTPEGVLYTSLDSRTWDKLF